MDQYLFSYMIVTGDGKIIFCTVPMFTNKVTEIYLESLRINLLQSFFENSGPDPAAVLNFLGWFKVEKE